MTTQPKIQFSIENDVRALSAMAAGLVPYVYEAELYGPLPGTLPRLTVGGFLMRLHRLDVIKALLTPDQQKILETAHEKFEAMRKEWPVAYEGKLERELGARLQALGQTVRDCAAEPRRCAEIYPSEVEKRVIVESLQDALAAQNVLSAQQSALIKATDNQLHGYTQPSDFIWDARLKPAYPAEKYWFLYASGRH